MRKTAVIPMLGVIILLGAGCSAAAPRPTANEKPQPAATTATPPESVSIEEGLIQMTDRGFSPTQITVPVGTMVVFKNVGTQPHWPASALHPTHLELPGFDALRGIPPDESYTYTFTKVGTWKFHDHLNPSYTGSVTVTP